MNAEQNNKSLLEKIKTISNLLYEKIKNFFSLHKMETRFFICFILYIALFYSLFIYNPREILNSSNKGFYIFSSLCGGFLLMIFYFFFKKKKDMVNNTEISDISFIMKIISTILFSGLILLFIYFIFYLYSSDDNITQYLIYLINFGIFIGLITLIVKYFKLNVPDYTSSKPSWLSLFKTCVLYIPCLFINLSDYVKKEYEIAPKSSIIIIIALTILIILRFLLPYLLHLFIVGGGKQLLKNPVYINKLTSLGNFQDLNYKEISDNKDSIRYKYAVSSWIYLDSFPPSTNRNYEKYTSILNIGNKPNLQVNIKKNSLRIIMKVPSNKSGTTYKNKVVYKTNNIKYQKWNNFVVNYDGKILDVFLNNELVASESGIIPYKEYDSVTCGTENGVSGGICNIIYFNNNLSRNSIHMLYYASKDLNPPII
jgi:hypothetical protein